MSNTRRRRPPRPHPGAPRTALPAAHRDYEAAVYEPPRAQRDRPERRRPAPQRAEYDEYEEYEEPYDGDDDQEPGDPAAARDQRDDAVPGRYITVALLDEPMRIMPPGRWRQSAMRALREGDLDQFMERVLHPDDLDRYYDLDPDNDELGQMMADVNDLAGAGRGKPRGPIRSSRGSRRR